MIRGLWLAALAAFVAAPAAAQSITPDSYTDSIAVGASGSTTFTVRTPTSGPATNLVDIFFLADNTGSMGSVLDAVRTQATSLLGDINATGINAAFGVGSYFGDPIEGTPRGGPTIGNFGNAYNLITPVTTNTTTVTNGIGQWFASGGGDAAEGGLFALHQVASSGGATDGVGPSDTGAGTGLDTGWRTGAQKVIVWFGDVNQHTDTVNVAEAISALTGEDVIVIAISTTSPGLNGTFDGEPGNQGLDIANATGGLDLLSSTAGIVQAILDAIDDVTSTIDLSLIGDQTFAGLTYSITCTSAVGCDDVGPDEARTFSFEYTGVTAGVYDLLLTVPGLSGVEADVRIVVGDDTVIPVPAALPLLLTGFAGLAFAGRRRRKNAA